MNRETEKLKDIIMQRFGEENPDRILEKYDYANILAKTMTYDEILQLFDNADESKKQMLLSVLKELK